MAVQQTISQMPKACGLAIIVSNGYSETNSPLPGTYQDAMKMKKAFSDLQFATHLEHNVIKDRMEKLAAEAAKSKFTNSYRCIAFVFSGHGQDANHIISEDEMLVNIQELINQFLPVSAPVIGRIPKLFFIDACRGADRMVGLLIPKGFKPSDKMTVPPEGNFLVAYSNMPGYVSYEVQGGAGSSGGGLWMSTLAKYLPTSDEDIGATLTLVNKELMGRFQSKHGAKAIQQPEYMSRLNDLVKLRTFAGLPPSSGPDTKPIPGPPGPTRNIDPVPPPGPAPVPPPGSAPVPTARTPLLREFTMLENRNTGKSVKIIARVQASWKKLVPGFWLPDETTADLLAMPNYTVGAACEEVFRMWLEGGDDLRMPRTWNTVIFVMENILSNAKLGREIRTVLNGQ